MNEETINMSIRTFLKKVGIKSQHEIEQTIAQAITNKKLKGNEKVPVTMTLSISQTGLKIEFEDVICLE